MGFQFPVFATLEHYYKRNFLEVTKIKVDTSRVPEIYRSFVEENKDLLQAHEEKLNLNGSNLINFVNSFCELYGSFIDNPLAVKVTRLWYDNLTKDHLSDPIEVMGLIAIIYHEEKNKV